MERDMNGEHTKPVESRTEDLGAELARTNGKRDAFPTVPESYSGSLSKRELFAAMAMQGAIASGQLRGPSDCVSYAMQCADTLLKELAK
jgi:hypothetical protein